MKNRKRNRIKGFDYSSNNLCFITNCVKDNLCCFGNVISDADIGTGCDLSVHYFENHHSESNYSQINQCGNIVIRLNLFGEIIKNQIEWLENQYPNIDIHNYVIMPNHFHLILEINSLKVNVDAFKIKSLTSLMGALKTTTSRKIHELGFLDFCWHRSFHDYIIRNEKEYELISNYID